MVILWTDHATRRFRAVGNPAHRALFMRHTHLGGMVIP